MSTVDVLALPSAADPAEWRDVLLEESLAARRAVEGDDDKRLRRMGFAPTWERELRDVAAGRRFFLLRNIWHWGAPATGRTETYFTYGGIERPFCGLDEIYGLFEQRMQESMAAGGMVVDACLLGAIEPISQRRALTLYRAIRFRTQTDLRPTWIQTERG